MAAAAAAGGAAAADEEVAEAVLAWAAAVECRGLRRRWVDRLR